MEMTRRNVLAASIIGGIGLKALGGASSALAQETTTTAAPTAKSVKAQVIIFDGFQITDGLAPYDVLQASHLVGSAFDYATVALDGASSVTSFDGMVVQPTAAFDPATEVLIVPGGPRLWRAGEAPPGLYAALQAYHARGGLLTSVCTGGVFLARAGLLKGRNATTHHGAFDAIAQEGANVIHARVVDDGDIVTAAGVTSGIDLGLYLVEKFYGPQIANQTEQAIEFERRGVIWRAA